MEEQENLQAIMSLIMYAGNAKSDAMEAITAAKQGDFDSAEEKLKNADESLRQAHQAQTQMLAAEAQGLQQQVTLLMVHSQDHLMTAINFKDLAKEMIDLYHRLEVG